MLSKKEYFKQSKSYNIKLTLKDKDISQELVGLRIVSSINTPYLLFILDLYMNPNDIILEQIFGQDPMKLDITLLEQDGIPKENLNYEIMYVKSNFKFTMNKQISDTNQVDRVKIKIYCLPRKEFKFASTTVNDIYHGKKVREILEDLCKKINATLQMDDGENQNVIDQVIIPPVTILTAIKFLDKNFGLYDGPNQITYEDNKIIILNLKKQMSMGQTFTIHHLTTDSDQSEIIKKCNDGKNFYTYDSLKSNFDVNTKIPIIGNIMKHITMPSDSLYHTIETNFKDLSKKAGLIFENSDIKFDKNLSDRVKYFTSNTGYEKTDTVINSMMSKFVSSMAKLSMNIERNLPIKNLLDSGKSVKFNSGTTEYSDLTGKYILKSSDIIFTKSNTLEWTSNANINLIRSNKTI